MRRRSVLAVTTSLFFSGCSTGPKRVEELSFVPISPNDFAQRIQLPILGSVERRNLGEPIIASRNVSLLPILRLPLEADLLLPYNEAWQVSTRLLAGEYRAVAKDTIGGTYFRSTRSLPARFRSTKPNVADSPNEDQVGGVYVSTAGEQFAYLHWKNASKPSSLRKLTSATLDQSTVEVDLPEDQLQKEIIYLGIVQNVLTLRYREYWKKMSRPAFDQDLRYDLSLSKIVGFRESRFEVIEATNTHLTYRVLSHLP